MELMSAMPRSWRRAERGRCARPWDRRTGPGAPGAAPPPHHHQPALRRSGRRAAGRTSGAAVERDSRKSRPPPRRAPRRSARADVGHGRDVQAGQEKDEDAGIDLRILCYNMKLKNTTDDEIEYWFMMARLSA